MDPVNRLLQLRAGNLRLTGQVRERLDTFVTTRWDAMESWHDDDMIAFENDVLPVVAAANAADPRIAETSTVSSVASNSRHHGFTSW